MIDIQQHELRGPLTDELHARPFVPIDGAVQIVHIAVLTEPGAPKLRPEDNLAHLNIVLEHLGCDAASATDGQVPNFVLRALEGFQLKWERHTEFASFLFVIDKPGAKLFEPRIENLIPTRWFDENHLRIIAACRAEVIFADSKSELQRLVSDEMSGYFIQDSLAMSWVTEMAAVAMCDFQIDKRGFTRIGLVAHKDEIGPRRLGRIVQRLIELETYRVLAMLALPVARQLSPELMQIENRLAKTARSIADDQVDNTPETDRNTLDALTSMSADLEKFSWQSAYRFSAARAYEALVYERTESLRESRFSSRQTFKEFMTRRFNPAMRTIRATDDRMNALSSRGERAANLLRTRIDVALETQNQKLLKSMDTRAKLQLRLQETVEGLSVVAISYYAVSLAGYVAGPFFKAFGHDEKLAKAVIALPVIAIVWYMVRRVKKRLEG